VERTTLGRVRASGRVVFVKPITARKLFAGLILRDDAAIRRRLIHVEDSTEVWACDPVEFVSEYRVFVLDHEIVDVRRYRGDFARAPSREVVERATTDLRAVAPCAYAIDFGITDDGRTLLVEMNDGFSFGTYGLAPTLTARILSARWNELAVTFTA
jgi:hypothetical protein